MALSAPAEDPARSRIGEQAVAVAFDPRFYRAVYTDLPAEMDPLWHYRVAGWREPRDPTPWFSTESYLQDHPDVAEAGVEPFAHFLLAGRYEGRDVAPSRHAWSYMAAVGWTLPPTGVAPRIDQGAALSPAQQRAIVEPEFDAAYYRALNPDVAAAGLDPLDHFLQAGWGEGRDPNPQFSVRDYLEANPDVASAGLNPFVHYLVAGRAEGRAPRLDLGFRYDVLSRARPVADRLADAIAAAARIRTDPPSRLESALDGVRDLHLTLSHDDYVRHSGGLQLCVRRESARFAAAGVRHLHLYPVAPAPMVRAPGEPGPLGVLIDGHSVGVFAPETIAAALAANLASRGRRSFAIHSLLGHDAAATADILAASGLRKGYFWLHDFASVCASFHLLRNDVEDCGAPPPDSAACGICAYGPWRSRHLEAHRTLFERLDLTVVSPSPVTLEFWRRSADLRVQDTIVLPHATLTPRGRRRRRSDGPFRVAYLGMPTALKGWPIFRDLARRFADDPRYAFVHLGGRPDPAAPAEFHPVTVTADRPDAMRDALSALAVDAALIWPLCRETFSFTAYEAAAAGAAILTGPDSGNVAAFATEPGRGAVLADEAALEAAFEDGAVLRLPRGATHDLTFSGLTADLVRPDAR
jgi:hypothetical protein